MKDKISEKLMRIETDILDHELRFLYENAYLRLKRLLANEWVLREKDREDISGLIYFLEKTHE